MFGLDGYAMAYGIALGLTLCVAALLGGCARIKGTALMIFAWFITLGTQHLAGDNAVTMVFASIDVAMFCAFWTIAIYFNRTWAQIVAGLHAVMILTHAIYVWRGETEEFVYLSILAGLGYASMLVIAGPPLIRKAVEIWRGGTIHGSVESVDLKHFVRGRDLPASIFHGKAKAPESGES